MKNLIAHKSNSFKDLEAQVSWELKDESIDFEFLIKSSIPFYTSDKFSSNYFDNKGLWDFDVVEVFLKKEGVKYLEFQCSPLGQPFSYLIEKPRVSFDYPSKLNISTKVEVLDETIWKTWISIPYSDIPGSGTLITGNCFACLGKETQYFALNINTDDRPDFHRPELFIDFGDY